MSNVLIPRASQALKMMTSINSTSTKAFRTKLSVKNPEFHPKQTAHNPRSPSQSAPPTSQLPTIMDSIALMNNESPRTPQPRRSRRTRQSSSLSGMFEDTNAMTKSPSASPTVSANTSSSSLEEDNSDLQDLARRLRRTKRSLLLKSTETPTSPVDQFRSIIMTLSSSSSSPVSPAPIFPGHSD